MGCEQASGEACGRGAQGCSQKRFWNFRYQANRLYCSSQASGLREGRKGTKQRQVSYSALSTGWGTLADEGAFGRGDALGLGVGEEATLDPWSRAPGPLLPAPGPAGSEKVLCGPNGI